MVQTILVFFEMFKSHHVRMSRYLRMSMRRSMLTCLSRGKAKSVVNVIVDNLIVDHANADAAFSFEQAVDGISAHAGGQDAVEGAGGAATLNVAQAHPR
jgi:hypothetical protein